jgi:ubiquitin-protein ligase E3 C
LADVFSDPKMARLLASIPQALPFDRRVKLFDSLLRADKMRTQDETAEMHQAMLAMMRGRDGDVTGREKVEIRRDHLYDDSMRQLNQLGPKLKRRVQVSFINQHGAHEAGIDGGGVFKEFIDDLIKDAFSIGESTASHHLFSVTPLQTLAVNSDLLQDQSLLSHYEFLGRVLGKAVYESILVEPQFCLPFLNQLLGKSNSMEDLKNFDLEYYRNLTKLLNLTNIELESMGLAFELTIGSGATAHTVELIPGGRNVQVTKQNVIQYIHLVSHQRLNVETAQQTRAFLRGFRDLIPASWVRLFSAYELQKVISGDDSVQGIDVGSLKRVMQYAAGYHPDQAVVQWFWEIVDEMTVDQQHKLLKFMTSCSRQPLLGFESLEPAPCLQQIRLPDAIFELNDKEEITKRTPLPTSSTCMNLLKLPNYRWKGLMRRKLLAAIESGSGFELT